MPILYNLGCKLNQYEGHALCAAFADDADVVIVNTCCVTREAEIKSLRRLRHCRRKYPGKKLVATGCLCLLHPEKFAEADRIISLPDRNKLIDRSFPKPEKSRYFLKIQDGCTEPCTYCIVPRVRPKLESKDIPDILREIAWVRENGFGEVVLVGANIGLYGQEQGRDLAGLIQTLAGHDIQPRVRLSSIEPRFLTPELLSALAALRVCRHFHIPIQSADDSVLKAMGRRGDRSALDLTINRIAKAFPEAAIGADIIVGFPAEDEAAFLRTYEFIREKPFTHLHVFPYSPRPGTQVESLGDPVPAAVKKERRLRLQKLIHDKHLEFRRALAGQILDAVVERNSLGEMSALTDNYLWVRIAGSHPSGARIKVKITVVEPHVTAGMVEK